MTGPTTKDKPPLSMARRELAACINTAQHARQAFEREHVMLGRLQSLQSCSRDAARELARLESAHEAELADWLLGCRSEPRPWPSPELAAAEASARTAERDYNAANRAIEKTAPARATVAAALQAAEQRLTLSVYPVVVEAAEELGKELRRRFLAIVEVQDQIEAIRATLVAPSPTATDLTRQSALAAAEKVSGIYEAIRRSVAPGPPGAGTLVSRFIDRLRTDPTATYPTA